MRLLFTMACMVLAAAPVTVTAAPSPFDPGTLDYNVSFGSKTVAWREFAFFVMPGDEVPLKVHVVDDAEVEVDHDGGDLDIHSPHEWTWTAPGESGRYSLVIRPGNAQPMQLHVMVKVPLSAMTGDALNGYRIGQYPKQPLRNNPIYLPPSGLIEVTRDMVDLPVSPHFTLGQFLCKQQPDHWPKYLLLREALVAKLEVILEEVNRRGIRTDSFVVMSGYRTPWYNQSIGNGRYSRHLWGGAADIYIDTNGDGRMDDLNGDGGVTIRDARLLKEIVAMIEHNGGGQRLLGGLGLYGPRPHRGPFVHVDARGHEARWELP